MRKFWSLIVNYFHFWILRTYQREIARARREGRIIAESASAVAVRLSVGHYTLLYKRPSQAGPISIEIPGRPFARSGRSGGGGDCA